MKPSKLLPLLAVPGTDDEVILITTEFGIDNEPYSGWLEDCNGNIVGRLDKFKFSFVNFNSVTNVEKDSLKKFGAMVASEPLMVALDLDDSVVRYAGVWFDIDGYLRGCNGDDLRCSVSLKTKAVRVVIKFHSHGWSGKAKIQVNGADFAIIDLFNESVAIPLNVIVENISGDEIEVSIHPTGDSALGALGRQVILEGIFLCMGNSFIVPAYSKPPVRNRGGDFKPRFFELLKVVESEIGHAPIILDVGGGKRQLGLDTYLNLEYASYEEPNLFGDGQSLPFKSDSIDLVYSAAVLEHVPDPTKMGREIYRVLKNGGRGLVNSAFMQPVHSEGQHFFNLTPYGIGLVLSKFMDIDISWMLRVAGIPGKVPAEELANFRMLVSSFDKHLTYDRLMYVASGVWGEVRK
jgi:SAM-dependent methyltransferase